MKDEFTAFSAPIADYRVRERTESLGLKILFAAGQQLFSHSGLKKIAVWYTLLLFNVTTLLQKGSTSSNIGSAYAMCILKVAGISQADACSRVLKTAKKFWQNFLLKLRRRE